MFFSNIRFLCKHYFRSARSIFGYLLVGVAALFLVPVLSVYLPRVVVQAVTEGWAFSRLALYVGGLSAGIALLNAVSMISGMKYSEKASVGRLEMSLRLEEVMMTCPYSLTEDPAWQTKIEDAGNAIYSDGRTFGIAGMVHTLQDFIINILGVFTFSAILGVLHPAVLIILVFTSLIPGVIANRVNQYNNRQRGNWLPYDKQINYIYNHVATATAGKEIRLYSAAGFFLRHMEEAILKRLSWTKKLLLRCLGADEHRIL